ncbi:MAG: type II CAAX prenyl endopeptidase Rce1 family protein [Candidatus Thorarchaeota archaeon]
MNDKEVQDINKNQEYVSHKDGTESNGDIWLFCPVCGNKIPKIQKLKYCISCGTNLEYLKEHKILQPQEIKNPYIIPSQYPQYHVPPVSYGPKKIPDDEIIDSKNQNLWGTRASIGIPLGAFLLMNFLTAGIIIILIYTSFNLELLYNIISNPYFLIFSSFCELIFIIVPVSYVAKYLKNPSLKNRLGLLGFTVRGFERKKLIKEIVLGLGFAIVGLFLVAIVSFLTEIILELFLGIEIVRSVSSTTSDIEYIIGSADIVSVILLSLVMILIIGTSEEILFRGFMQKGLVRSLGNKTGLIITALIFALIHVLGVVTLFLDDPLVLLVSFILSFIPYFAISLLLGFIYYWRKENLLAVIITHGVYDALTIIFAFLIYNFF